MCANVRVFCACCNGVVEQSDNAGRKENMIEWDILSAADVSWSPDCVCVCVCFYRGIPKSESPWTYSLVLYWYSKAATSVLT